jgi:polysaccharide pyruvyl transferase WcaK-like protein
MKFYYAGQSSFGNRGCEALVRTTTDLLRSRYSDSRFYTPSTHPELDQRQWPEAEGSGIRFVPTVNSSSILRGWNWLRRRVGAVEKLGRPSFRLSGPTLAAMKDADVVIMTGGDTISLDYDLPSLFFHAALIDNAKRLGKRAVLWAASVGPFSEKAHIEKLMKSHLGDYDVISVRESKTFAYLRQIGVERVIQTVDPAFLLAPSAFDDSALLPSAPEGLVGINVSPLIRRFRSGEASMCQLDNEVAGFIRGLVEDSGYGVLLVPHVAPLDGGTANSDYAYMEGLVERHSLRNARVSLVPPHLNARQLKFLIAKCRFFIGARTHATIAALSSQVPTISISYSVKARGINEDLFENDRVILPTSDVSESTLRASLRFLEKEEHSLRHILGERIPIWKNRARLPLEHLSGGTA